MKNTFLEKDYGFNLRESLEKARHARQPILYGISIYLTPHVASHESSDRKPSRDNLEKMIYTFGGQVHAV